MNVSGLLGSFESLEAYRSLRDELVGAETPPPLGLLRAARPAVVAALAQDLDKAMLVVAGSVERASELAGGLRDWSVDPDSILRFHEPPVLFYERAPWTEEALVGRLRVLLDLFRLKVGAQGDIASPRSKRNLIVVASARALMQRTIPLRQFRVSMYELRTEQLLDLDQTLNRWAGLGYEPVTVVEAPGQFSHRGGILDIFPPADSQPVRVELFGSSIESLRRFDPATQRSHERVDSVAITPAREALPRHGPRVAERIAAQLSSDFPPDVLRELEEHHRGLESSTPFPGIEFYLPCFYSTPALILDYLPSDSLVVIDDPQELADMWSRLEEESIHLRETAEEEGVLPADYPLPYVTWDGWVESLTDRPVLTLGHGEEGSITDLARNFQPGPRFGGQIKPVFNHIKASQADGGQIVVASQQVRRLTELWLDEHTVTELSVDGYMSPVDGLLQRQEAPVTFVQGALSEGWVLSGFDAGAAFVSLHVLTDAEIFGWRRPQARRPAHRRKVSPEARFSDLTPGDLVVHVEHGIGLFQGLVIRAVEGDAREYLLVQYAGQDRLFVPIYQADRLGRYIGADDRPPSLNRLGTAEWSTVKDRARHAAEEVARELLDLYAVRELVQGYAFTPDTAWQAELEAAFPYFETEDQLRAIADVKRDMENPRPMDRLICGDVGYGKTEVALRAAFKAVMDGKQVAVLVPTTILAQQHYATFRHRLSPFPIEVESLSRFRSPATQRKILERLLARQVDIVVGTHRLLQKDVAFADLGLLIIDEEQRFGVTHKEYLKRLRTEVDVLTMTATPIPRTLYMALTGVRDISVMETPPEERLPVNTYVGEYDGEMVRRAILRELERNGQVFYVHNRVQTIETVRQR
ncbi:MAG: DEAD/DEAH box helicase, partial [Anaerolineae bacterium]|nr:DEAD/DEAH box helicase [Anaerolineae bacterium]